MHLDFRRLSRALPRAVAFTLLLFLPLGSTSSSFKPRTYEFDLNGRVVDLNGGSLFGLTVGMLYRPFRHDTSAETDTMYLFTGAHSATLTNVNGGFSMNVTSTQRIRWITPIVLFGPDSMVTGDTLYLMGFPRRDIKTEYPFDDNVACTNPTRSRITSTRYSVPYQTIVLPELRPARPR